MPIDFDSAPLTLDHFIEAAGTVKGKTTLRFSVVTGIATSRLGRWIVSFLDMCQHRDTVAAKKAEVMSRFLAAVAREYGPDMESVARNHLGRNARSLKAETITTVTHLVYAQGGVHWKNNEPLIAQAAYGGNTGEGIGDTPRLSSAVEAGIASLKTAAAKQNFILPENVERYLEDLAGKAAARQRWVNLPGISDAIKTALYESARCHDEGREIRIVPLTGKTIADISQQAASEEILRQVNRLLRENFAASNPLADKTPPAFQALPAETKDAALKLVGEIHRHKDDERAFLKTDKDQVFLRRQAISAVSQLLDSLHLFRIDESTRCEILARCGDSHYYQQALAASKTFDTLVSDSAQLRPSRSAAIDTLQRAVILRAFAGALTQNFSASGGTGKGSIDDFCALSFALFAGRLQPGALDAVSLWANTETVKGDLKSVASLLSRVNPPESQDTNVLLSAFVFLSGNKEA